MFKDILASSKVENGTKLLMKFFVLSSTAYSCNADNILSYSSDFKVLFEIIIPNSTNKIYKNLQIILIQHLGFRLEILIRF